MEEVDRYLIDIFSMSKYIEVDGEIYKFNHPTNKVRQYSNVVYDMSYKKAIKSGLLSTSDLEKLIDSRCIITKEDNAKLSKLKSQLEAQEVLLGKTTLVKANQDRIKNAITRIRTDIYTIEYKKKSKMMMSADNKAEDDRIFYICSQCVYKDDLPFWESYTEALCDNRILLRDRILYEFSRFVNGFPNNIIRDIARNSLWRIRYITSMKATESLFGVPTSDYTVDQLNLAYWSSYYQNIYDMMPEDRPSDAVIEDDESLDAYMKALYEERSKENAHRRSKVGRPGKLSAFDSEEVIVTRSHELYQDIEYDTPREAQKLKDRVDIKKKAKRG